MQIVCTHMSCWASIDKTIMLRKSARSKTWNMFFWRSVLPSVKPHVLFVHEDDLISDITLWITSLYSSAYFWHHFHLQCYLNSRIGLTIFLLPTRLLLNLTLLLNLISLANQPKRLTRLQMSRKNQERNSRWISWESCLDSLQVSLSTASLSTLCIESWLSSRL